MRRRELVAMLGSVAAVWPRAVRAQPTERLRRVAFLNPGAEADTRSVVVAIARLLGKAGWTDGRTIRLEDRSSDNIPGKLAADAREIVHSMPDVLVAMGPPAVVALRQQTRAIPIVFFAVGDPLGYGLVDSVARPGGNITGVSNFEFSMGGKWAEVLKEIAPAVARMAFIYDPTVASPGFGGYLRSAMAAAPSLRVTVSDAPVRDEGELDRVIEQFAREPNSGLIIGPNSFPLTHRAQIIQAAARLRLPAVYPFDIFAKEGGLISYGVDADEQDQILAAYIDRILRGAKPADLPVQGPTKFQMVINLKAAKALGLAVPPTLLVTASEVIE